MDWCTSQTPLDQVHDRDPFVNERPSNRDNVLNMSGDYGVETAKEIGTAGSDCVIWYEKQRYEADSGL